MHFDISQSQMIQKCKISKKYSDISFKDTFKIGKKWSTLKDKSYDNLWHFHHPSERAFKN